MIRYSLSCRAGHVFESWFSSADAYDALSEAGRVTCPECGSQDVEKTLMAPDVQVTKGKPASAPSEEAPLTTPQNPQEAALAKLRDKIETNSEYVGMNFATEARAMHDGDAPARSIYGEAKMEDAKSLLDDGVPVAPLPFTPRSRAN